MCVCVCVSECVCARACVCVHLHVPLSVVQGTSSSPFRGSQSALSSLMHATWQTVKRTSQKHSIALSIEVHVHVHV